MSFTKINYVDNETIITAANLNAIQDKILNIDQSIDNIAQSIYPIGSIYMSINDTSPASFIGGTWERITDKFLLGSGSRNIEDTGGQESVSYTPAGKNTGTALSTSQMPKHTHPIAVSTSGTSHSFPSWGLVATYQSVPSTAFTGSAGLSGYAGSGSSHTHTFTGTASTIATMPPYLVVNIWKRVS